MDEFTKLAKEIGFYRALDQFENRLWESLKGTPLTKAANLIKLPKATLAFRLKKAGITLNEVNK